MDTIYNCYFAAYQDHTNKEKDIQTVYLVDTDGHLEPVVQPFPTAEHSSYSAWIACQNRMIDDILTSMRVINATHPRSKFQINFVMHQKLTHIQSNSLKMLLAVFEQYKGMPYNDLLRQTVARQVRGKTGKPYTDPLFLSKFRFVDRLLEMNDALPNRLTITRIPLNTSTHNAHSLRFNGLYQMAMSGTLDKVVDEVAL